MEKACVDFSKYIARIHYMRWMFIIIASSLCIYHHLCYINRKEIVLSVSAFNPKNSYITLYYFSLF